MSDESVSRYIRAAAFHPLHIAAVMACIVLASVAIFYGGAAPWLVLPILAALEVGYLGFYGTSDRCRRMVEEKAARKAKALTEDNSPQAAAQRQKVRFDELYKGLDPSLRKQFDELRKRCDAFNDMSDQYSTSTVAKEQLSGVNKLLWVYLKLLHTKMKLDRFFETMNTEELDRQERDALRRLEDLPSDALDPITEKKRSSIEDTIQTVRARRENVKRALENRDFVILEIDRIAVKLTGICEMAINRQDPGAITQDVDGVARSVEATEQAIGELNLFTGFTAVDDMAPDILSETRQKVH